MKKTTITTTLSVANAAQEDKVAKAFTLMVTNFGANGIIKMAQLFQKDAFVRAIVKQKLK